MQTIQETMANQPLDSKLAYRTCFSSLSYYGHKLDILKSGLQKYMRRREEEKMLWCLGEIYLFKVYARTEQEKKATRGIITNLINRIIVMLDEELLFIEWDKYLMVYNLIEKFEKSDRNDFISLIKICKILCNSRLLRRNSDIRAHFNFNMRKADSNKPDNLVEKESEEDTDNWYFRNFKKYFEKGDHACFYWMFMIYTAQRTGDKRRFNRKDNIYIVWEFLFKIAFGNPLLTRCLNYRLKEFYNKSKKERCIFLTAAIDLCLEKDNINWDANMLLNEPEADEKDVEKMFKNRKRLTFDNYVIDMHTSLGRKLGKNGIDFMEEGSYVKDEDSEFIVEEWRDSYQTGKLESYAKKLAEKKRKAMAKVEKEKKKAVKKAEKEKKKTVKIVKSGESNSEEKTGNTKVKKEKTEREKARAAKYKRIKKLRGKPNFDDLEKNLEFIDGQNIDVNYIKLCSDTTCGNKVMCFEFVSASWGKPNTVWKESRKSMNYNRDYACVDNCKEIFGLEKIGMKRVLSNFRIEKIDKNEKSWVHNWKKVYTEDEKVVYCVMDKIEPGTEIGKKKKELLNDRSMLKEFVKIGVFRGIFRVSDFNGRNVLIKDDSKLVSIDEGDIGKRLDIIGGRERWLIKALNKDKTIINEIINELRCGNILSCLDDMERYKFGLGLIEEVENNWKNLKKDLEEEGIEF